MNSDSATMNFTSKLVGPPVQDRLVAADSETDRLNETWSLNFATSINEECEIPFVKKPKTIRDPLSHRIIEKRRRDRMNNCLADLSRLIPTNYMKQGQGRIEKTEIIEMAIKHINNLTSIVNKQGTLKSSLPDRYIGFKECQDEMMRYLVEVEELEVHSKLCSSLMAHLEQAGEKFRIMNDESLSQAAKEEQYRHLEEDCKRSNPAMTPVSEKVQEYAHPTDAAPMTTLTSTIQNPQPNIVATDCTLQNNSSSYMGLDALATAQAVTQEQLKQDKHLWNLLTTAYTDQPVVEDSGLSTGTVSNTSNKTVSSHYMSRHDEGHLYKVPQEPVSNFSSASMETGSDKHDYSVYKFKHNITKRFSQEEKKVMTSDSSSLSSSSLDNKCKVKRKISHGRSRSPSSFSTNYPNSDSSHGSSGVESNGPLPGFILHPGGTHYVPLSIHPTDIITDIFKKDSYCRRKVFHPISIPVNFSGPRVCMKSVEEWKTVDYVEPSVGSGDSPGAPSSENSGSSPMESSPTNEQDTKNGPV